MFHSPGEGQPTPLQRLDRLSDELSIDLRVKRDDLYPFAYGGNKARKIRYIVADAEKTGATALVTAGGGNSNHVRVTAIAGAKLGWKVCVVIHDSNETDTPNLKLARLAGAEFVYAEKTDVPAAMESAMKKFVREGHTPYYIWGGGHTVHGMEAYVDAVHEFGEQSNGWQPDYVLLASGTGGTQTGLHAGFSKNHPKAKIVGISIARSRQRGVRLLGKSLASLSEHLKMELPETEVVFWDEWNGGGYERNTPGVFDVIKKCAETEGLTLDPVYTGKAMKALFDLRKRSWIPENTNVLFWHTGGEMNLLNAAGY